VDIADLALSLPPREVPGVWMSFHGKDFRPLYKLDPGHGGAAGQVMIDVLPQPMAVGHRVGGAGGDQEPAVVFRAVGIGSPGRWA